MPQRTVFKPRGTIEARLLAISLIYGQTKEGLPLEEYNSGRHSRLGESLALARINARAAGATRRARATGEHAVLSVQWTLAQCAMHTVTASAHLGALMARQATLRWTHPSLQRDSPHTSSVRARPTARIGHRSVQSLCRERERVADLLAKELLAAHCPLAPVCVGDS